MSDSYILSAAEIALYYATRAPQIRQRSKQWRGPCLLHRGKNHSFSVNPETGCWYCFSDCGRGGSLIDLEMELNGVSFRTALAAICDIIGRPQPWSQIGSTEKRISRGEWLSQRRNERDAAYFASAAVLLIEGELECLPFDSPQRRCWTRLLAEIRADAIAMYGGLRQIDERAAKAWAYAGRQHQRRTQLQLVRIIQRLTSEDFGRAA